MHCFANIQYYLAEEERGAHDHLYQRHPKRYDVAKSHILRSVAGPDGHLEQRRGVQLLCGPNSLRRPRPAELTGWRGKRPLQPQSPSLPAPPRAQSNYPLSALTPGPRRLPKHKSVGVENVRMWENSIEYPHFDHQFDAHNNRLAGAQQ